MSLTSARSRGHRVSGRALLLATVALATGALTGTASAATVTGGGFDWTMANYYDSSANDTLGQRTWLGFVVNTVAVAGPASAGSVSAGDGATITDRSGTSVGEVTGTSPAGLSELYKLSYPATGGTYDEYTGAGSIQLGGTLSWSVHPGLGLLPQTIVNPTLTLDGTSATLTASGTIDTRPYASDAIFTFGLQSSLVTLKADGSRVISAIARTGQSTPFFGARYLPSNGTESFALRLKLKPDEIRGPIGPGGPAGPAGPQGKSGKTIRLQTSVLKRAPFPGGKKHTVRVLSTKGKKVVAKGSVRARTLRVQLASTQKKALRGVYLVKHGKAPAIRVRVL